MVEGGLGMELAHHAMVAVVQILTGGRECLLAGGTLLQRHNGVFDPVSGFFHFIVAHSVI